MRIEERLGDFQEAIRIALDSLQAKLWTAMPCIVESYDPDAMTLVATPAVQSRVRLPGGGSEYRVPAQLLDVPVVFPRGGGFTLTFPIAQGDEVLVVFSSRCIDSWWTSGEVQPPASLRMHSLSDGFALPGLTSQVRLLDPAPSTSSVVLRSDDGETKIELTDGQVANIIAPGGINLETDGDITMQAANLEVTAAAEFTGTLKNNNVNVGSTHTHTGVTVGGGVSGPPVP